MKLFFGEKDGATVDIMPRIDEDAGLIVTDELERDAFERVVGDCHIRASNIDGFFSTFFRDKNATARFEVAVQPESRVTFRGEIDNESIRFDANGLYVEFDVFSKNKLFWDTAKTTKVVLNFTEPEKLLEYSTVGYVLAMNLGATRKDSNGDPIFYGDIFSALSISTVYSSRPIRFYADGTDNAGKYKNLDPETTVFDLLTAMAKYYNAEFYIDPATQFFVMQPRLTPNGTTKDVTGELCDDTEINVAYLDSAKYDYIYTMFDIVSPPTPGFIRFVPVTLRLYKSAFDNGGSFPNSTENIKTLIYHLTYMIGEEESNPSLPLIVEVPACSKVFVFGDPTQELDTNLYDYTGYLPVITLPAGYANSGKRRLYRNEIRRGDQGTVYLIDEYRGFDPVDSYTDNKGLGNQWPTNTRLPVNHPIAVCAWIGFDEETGTWLDPILDLQNGATQPAGKIFTVHPELRFLNLNLLNSYEENPYNIFAFFGKDNNLETVREIWYKLLITIRGLSFKVKGIDFCVADEITEFHSSVFAEMLDLGIHTIVKKASVDLIAEETELECVSL